MPNFKLYCDPKPDYYYFDKTISQRIEKGESGWLALVPVNRAVRQWQRRLIDVAADKILAKPAIYTIDDLLVAAYNNLPNAKIVLNNDILIFFMEEILRREAGNLTYFPKNAVTQSGLAVKIASTVGELRRFGYSAAELQEKSAEELEMPQEKRADFIRILSALEALLGQRYIDRAHAICSVASCFTPELLQPVCGEIKEIFISGYGLFTPAYFDFISASIDKVNVAIKLEYHPQNSRLFTHTFPAYQKFMAMGAQQIVEHNVSNLAKGLFKRDTQSGLQNSSRYQLFPAKDSEQEIKQIATSIKNEIVSKRLKPSEMALTFANLEQYVPTIHRIFKELDLPYNLSTGFGLKQSPLVQFMLTLPLLSIEKFPIERVFKLIRSPFIYGVQNGDLSLLYTTLVQMRQNHLTPHWEKNDLIKSKVESDERFAQQVAVLQQFLTPFYAFETAALNSAQFYEQMVSLLDSCGALNWYQNTNQAPALKYKEREYRAFNRFMKLLDQFSWSMQKIYANTTFNAEEWLKKLGISVSQVTYNLTEWPQDAVQIMPRLEIQAVPYKRLYLGGLIDGVFPRSLTADIFFTDSNRTKMGLLATASLQEQDRFMFFSLLEAAEQDVLLSWPQFSGDKAFVPSTFISDMQDIFKLEQYENSHFNQMVNVADIWNEIGSAIQLLDSEKVFNLVGFLEKTDENETLNQFKYVLTQAAILHQRSNTLLKFGPFEGQLAGDNQILGQIENKYGNRVWSITQLEQYAFCPMQFLLQRILKLNETPEMEESISALERGNVLHDILFKFYRYLISINQTVNPLRFREKLFEIANQELKTMPFKGLFWELEKQKILGSDEIPGLLDTFLAYEQQMIDENGFIPHHFEFAFGHKANEHCDPASTTVLLKLQDKKNRTLSLNGKIDRIDLDKAKQNAMIFDYKTGRYSIKKAQDILKGKSFQLPVYTFAVEQLIGTRPNVVLGGYYLIKDAQNCQRSAAMMDRDAIEVSWVSSQSPAKLPNKKIVDEEGNELTFNALLNKNIETIFTKRDQLFSGDFSHCPTPDDAGCKSYCTFKRICQKQVNKITRQAEMGEKQWG